MPYQAARGTVTAGDQPGQASFAYTSWHRNVYVFSRLASVFARRLVAANERREGEGDSDIQYPSLSYVLCSSRLK